MEFFLVSNTPYMLNVWLANWKASISYSAAADLWHAGQTVRMNHYYSTKCTVDDIFLHRWNTKIRSRLFLNFLPVCRLTRFHRFRAKLSKLLHQSSCLPNPRISEHKHTSTCELFLSSYVTRQHMQKGQSANEMNNTLFLQQSFM